MEQIYAFLEQTATLPFSNHNGTQLFSIYADPILGEQQYGRTQELPAEAQSSFCRINEKKSKIRSKTMLKLDSIKAEIPAIRPVLAEVGDSL